MYGIIFSKTVELGKVWCTCPSERLDCLVQKLGFDGSLEGFSHPYLPSDFLSLGVVMKRPLVVGSPV